MNSRLIFYVSIALGLILTVGIGSVLLKKPYQVQGSLLEPPIPAEDFGLVDQHGDPFRLSDQRGDMVLIFFGYTHCPDICPSTLSEFQSIKKGLAEDADSVEFVFVTVDPERDTPQVLAEYLGFFDPDFIGLSADRETLRPVWDAYGVYQNRRDVNSAVGYLVDHSTRMYVIDRTGNLILTYPFGFETEKIIHDLAYLLSID
jgi:protein SCO1/2